MFKMAQTTRITSEQQQDGDKMQAANKTQNVGGKVKPSYKHIPHSQKPPHLVAKRNARERRRVQAVNQAFYKLRKSVPIENRNKRVSKVKTLQRAIDYIRRLERILAEDEANGDPNKTSSAVSHLEPQASSKLLQEAPLQQNTSQTNLSSHNQNEPQQTRNNSKLTTTTTSVATTSDEHQTENDSSKASLSRPKGRPKRVVECVGLNETGAVVKRLQQASGTTTDEQQKQKRGRKQTNNKQLTGDLRQNNNQTTAIHQLARDQQAQFTDSLEAPHDRNNYGALKSASGTATGEPTIATTANTMPVSNVYFAPNAGVSYGRPRDTTATSLMAAPTNHYPNHHYHYYADSPVSNLVGPSVRIGPEQQQAHHNQHHHHQQQQQQHQFMYNNHLQLPPDNHQQQHNSMRNEISSSSMSTTNGSSVCECQPANYYYGGSINNNCSHLPLNPDTQSISGNRLVNHDSFLSPVDSSSSGQQRYLSPVAHQYTNPWHAQQQQPAASDELELCKQTPKHANDKTEHKITRIDTHSSSMANGANFSQKHHQRLNHNHQQEQYEQKTATSVAAAAQLMPADSTSSSGTPRSSFNQKVPPPHASSIGSPPVSICSSSSSSLSPSTTLKSLDLSGGSSSSTSGAMFSVANSNTSDKSPTSTNGTPVVCRQPTGSNNNSNNDNGAHSTTVRGVYTEPHATSNGQQQVNNYRNLHQSQTYALAHLSYGALSNGGNTGYDRNSRLQHQQQQQQPPPPPPPPDEQRAGKLITDDQNKSQSDNMVASLEVQHKNGSRSSSVISPLPAQSLTLVGGDYLANNNLHGNSAVQLFQQQPTYYDHHHQQHLNYQHHHHHQQQQQQQSQYQGQHFLGNQHNQQQHYSNHLSDHHNHHLQPSELSVSELRQPNVNTIELVTTTNTSHHQQSPLNRLGLTSSTATISPGPTQYTVLPL